MIITQQASATLKATYGIQFQPGLSIYGDGLIASPSMIYGGGGSLNNVSLGGYSYLVPNFEASFLSIGNYTSIAKGFIVGLGHPTDLLTASPVAWRPWMAGCLFPGQTSYKYLTTRIGSDVWVGANVVVKAGVSIGDGCFIGAGSVVTKDIPSFSVAVGNPCRVIRPRFVDQVLERIQHISWFDYDWRDEWVDWREPVATLNAMQVALENGFNRKFNFFQYQIDGEKMNIKKMNIVKTDLAFKI
jgi:hypothetical protein